MSDRGILSWYAITLVEERVCGAPLVRRLDVLVDAPALARSEIRTTIIVERLSSHKTDRYAGREAGDRPTVLRPNNDISAGRALVGIGKRVRGGTILPVRRLSFRDCAGNLAGPKLPHGCPGKPDSKDGEGQHPCPASPFRPVVFVKHFKPPSRPHHNHVRRRTRDVRSVEAQQILAAGVVRNAHS